MPNRNSESLEDYLGKLNIEGSRNSWIKKRRKINFVLAKTRSYFSQAHSACDIGIGDGYLLRHFAKLGLETTGVELCFKRTPLMRDLFAAMPDPLISQVTA